MRHQTLLKPHADSLWYKDAIIYELHVRAFYDSNGDGNGDFQGLIQKLDYLQDLGVTTLWLLPFYPSPLRDDGYDIADYRSVHPDYGSLRDFRLFVQEAHARGLKVVTELVVNHTSDQHPWFQAARRARMMSRKRHYYVWSHTDTKYAGTRVIFLDTEKSNWTWDPLAGAYYWHRFFSHQPDLNYAHPQVLRAVFRTMRFWLDMGVDGFRLDAIPYLCEREGTINENLSETHAVLKEMRRLLDQYYEDRMFLAEANQWPVDVLPYFGDGDECHMAFHFPLMPRIFMALRQADRHPMGDNIFLGDRNGVRTPMQWSGDRNAGFSRADPQRLYLPVIMDPVYGYQTVNVESQERNSASLLWWMKRAIALRKQHKVFGRGRTTFLSPDNRKILAYVRHDEVDTILVLANLSNQVQPVTLDLTSYEGLMPQEMIGGAEFPTIGTAPYFMSLGPYASYWFILHAPEPVMIWTEDIPDASEVLATALPVLVLSGRWETLFAQGPRRRLEADVLPAYLARQRWFSGKARTMAHLRLVDYCMIQATAPLVYLVLVEVTYTDGGTETYALVLGISAGETADALCQTAPNLVLARLRGPQGEGLLHNAMGTEAAAAPLLSVIEAQRRLAGGAGELRAFTTRAYPEARGGLDEPLAVRLVQTEQSNSSIIYGSRLMLKVIRRVEAGVNPELDMGRYVTDKVALPFVPPLLGSLSYHRPGSASTTLALLHGYVRNGGNGWDYTLDLLGRYYEHALGFTELPVGMDLSMQGLLARAAEAIPEEAGTAVGTYLVPAENLGQRTAALHMALA